MHMGSEATTGGVHFGPALANAAAQPTTSVTSLSPPSPGSLLGRSAWGHRCRLAHSRSPRLSWVRSPAPKVGVLRWESAKHHPNLGTRGTLKGLWKRRKTEGCLAPCSACEPGNPKVAFGNPRPLRTRRMSIPSVSGHVPGEGEPWLGLYQAAGSRAKGWMAWQRCAQPSTLPIRICPDASRAQGSMGTLSPALCGTAKRTLPSVTSHAMATSTEPAPRWRWPACPAVS